MKKRFESLDAFRGLCAVCLVVYHMALIGSITELDFFKKSTILVEFFFVLSGFVLAHAYAFGPKISFINYVKARILRIYPLHIFMLLIFIILEAINLLLYKSGYSFGTVPFSDKNGLDQLLPNFLLLQSWLPFTHPLSFNGPSWSISVEFYMYLILFATIVIFKKQRLFIWVSISSIAFMMLFVKYDFPSRQVFRGLSCFFAGAVVYVFYNKFRNIKFDGTIASLVEMLLLLCVVLITQSDLEYRSILASLLFVFVVLVYSYEFGCVSRLLKGDFFQLLGKISFSIYMTHYALVIIIKSCFMVIQNITGKRVAPLVNGSRFIDLGSPLMNNLLLFLFIFLVIVTSLITYRYVEIKTKDFIVNKFL
ncbi:acyltransferase [Vibrio breoganii]|uniref:Acyltransferase n=1 Tax=Vibrio breoganii TaxID=553239 RepID=A0AAN0XYF6_9VIBR|nr:acyltransferase [Vibrio breoganii]ANO34976.1 acyltransferase [Vibrio breoganii]